MIIYKATNLVNGKIYIGQTTEDFSERIRKHWASARSNKKNNRPTTYFQNALLKYGEDNFKWEIIDYASSIDELNDKEAYWIAKLNAQDREVGYNRDSGGKNCLKHEETKKKISEKKLEDWKNPELASRMREGLKKATEKWKEICLENLVEVTCLNCGEKFYLPPAEAKNRQFCSLSCLGEKRGKENLNKANEANKQKYEDKCMLIRQSVLDWLKNNKELVISCPANKISTTLSEIQEIGLQYGIKDWRSISKAICGNPSKKALLMFLLKECEKIC